MQKNTIEIEASVVYVDKQISKLDRKIERRNGVINSHLKLIESLDKDLGKIERVNDQFVEDTKAKQLKTSGQIQKALELTNKLQGLETTFKQLKS